MKQVRKMSMVLLGLLVLPVQAELLGVDVSIVADEVTVTATRESQKISEVPATVNVLHHEEIASTRPAHPSEIMRKIPGVFVNVTNGEGHQTSIRQPLTTNPVYLYLEDGIPTRSTGFFNHNALYEINLPQSYGIEIIKGPATALYGSDSIGGIVNVLSRPSPDAAELDASFEAGSYGWKRFLITGGTGDENWGIRPSLNVTHSDGWRDATGYDRKSFSLRWDQVIDHDTTVKTLLSAADIQQQGAGSTRLRAVDYYNNPTLNYQPISYRNVEAIRLSSAYEKTLGASLVSLTPYLRYNNMGQLPNYVGNTPNLINNSRNHSYGLLAKYRQDFEPMRSRLIVGVDVDRSPGSYWQNAISTAGCTQAVGGAGAIQHHCYTVGAKEYDYAVTYTGVSPYLHGEFSPLAALRVTAGLRYDRINYDYENNLTTLQAGNRRRPASTEVDFSNVSPKLGATLQLSKTDSFFASYAEGFRAPSEGQLFQQGSNVNSVDLKPIKARNIEFGVRGRAGVLGYSAAAFYLKKTDDVLSFRDPALGGLATSSNNGETSHRGVELGLSADLSDSVSVNGAFSYIKHRYDKWLAVVGAGNVNFSGNEIESAPRVLTDISLDYAPAVLNGGKLQLEWFHMGRYRMDQANTAGQIYKGHDLFNLRANYFATPAWELFGRVMNLSDRRYAEAAAFNANGREFAPGLPRTAYVGLEYHWDAAKK